MGLNNILLCIYNFIYNHKLVVYLGCFPNRHSGCFHILAVVSNDAHRKWECRYHLEVVISFPLHICPKVGLLNHMVVLFFIFLRNFHTIYYYGCTSILSHQQYRSVLIFPHPLEHLLSLNFLIVVLLTGVMWYLFLVLIFISLMISDILNIFSYIYWHFVYLLWKNIFSGSFPSL